MSSILIVEADQATATFLCDQLTADDFCPAVVRTVEGAPPGRGRRRARPRCCSATRPSRAARWPCWPRSAPGAGPSTRGCPRSSLSATPRSSRSCAPSATAPTTSWPSRSAIPSCAPASRRCCAALAAPHRAADPRRRPRDRHPRADRRASAGEPIALTQREYALLVHLAADPERVFTKAGAADVGVGAPLVRRHPHARQPRLPPAREALAHRGPRVGHQRVGRRLRPAPQPRRGGMRRTPLRPGLAPARAPRPAGADAVRARLGRPARGRPRPAVPGLRRAHGDRPGAPRPAQPRRLRAPAVRRGPVPRAPPRLRPRRARPRRPTSSRAIAPQAAHAVAHLGLIGALRRLGGDRGARMEHR